MLNNINNSTNPNFGANLRITSPVKDSIRLQNIQKVFSEKTADMKDTLSMTRLGEEWNNMECYFLGTNQETAIGGFFKTSLDSMMETLSDNQIVTKLIKTLKAMKELNKREVSTFGFDDEKYRAKHEQKRNLLIAQGYKAKGDDIMASRFEVLANCFGKKLKKIEAEETKINNKFLKRLDSIAEGDKDILNLKESM